MGKQDHDAASPQFIKPGDDPEVDRLLAKLKQDCDDGDPFFVDFRKRPRSGTDGEPGNAAAVERPEPAARRAVVKTQRRQAKVIALGVLGIVGPIVVLGLGYLMSHPTVVVVAPAGAPDGPGQAAVGRTAGTWAAPSPGGAASGAGAVAAVAAGAVAAGPTPAVSAQGDAGAARPPAESSAAAPVKGQPRPKKEAPRGDAGAAERGAAERGAAEPGAGRSDPGEDIW